MNIVLSCYANKGKASFVLEKGGRVIDKEVFRVSKAGDSLLKEYIFEAIIRGLKQARNCVSHEDILLIGVQNCHMVDWLNGQKEYKGYESYLDEISDIVETLDCRYIFSTNGTKKAKKALSEDLDVIELESAVSLFKNM